VLGGSGGWFLGLLLRLSIGSDSGCLPVVEDNPSTFSVDAMVTARLEHYWMTDCICRGSLSLCQGSVSVDSLFSRA
jgi:hypothetical protein